MGFSRSGKYSRRNEAVFDPGVIMRVFHNEMFNFIQQKSPTTVSGEMNAIGILFSGGSNPC
ncbi:hypothetical protein [Siminovitchia terrae]|uniref:hypothetical protein n=1 Tax=Siminovitchia terrae TaxID=1914933 RepID=UPI000E73FB7B|nr:hypothetical protein [Siminovitchia terrae]